jgi:hypothetical protein
MLWFRFAEMQRHAPIPERKESIARMVVKATDPRLLVSHATIPGSRFFDLQTLLALSTQRVGGNFAELLTDPLTDSRRGLA